MSGRKLTRDQAREIAGSGEIAAELARRYSVSVSTIHCIRRGLIYKTETRDIQRICHRGGRHPSKLTDIQVRQIRASHVPATDLAARFSVHPSTIRAIRGRRRRKEVE